MKLALLAQTSALVAGTRSRLAKRDALAVLLQAADPADVAVVVSYLAGELRQRRTGVGWSRLQSLPPPASEASLTVLEVDAELERIAGFSGPGSATARSVAVADLFARATAAEQKFLRALMSGAIRQGALDSTMLEALAIAAGVALVDVRRAVMLAGDTGVVAEAVLRNGTDRAAALAAFDLVAGRPVRPMLAASAPDVSTAMAKIAGLAWVDMKLDGVRLQAHKSGSDVRLFTRSLDDVTVRLPSVAEVVRSLPADQLILDGEVIALAPDGRPRPFQETAAQTAQDVPSGPLSVFFFDCLLHDGRILLDQSLSDRADALDRIVSAEHRVRRLVTADPAAATAFFQVALAAGHEGVVVKDAGAGYQAGRRGSGWIKVKPRHTLDLVVLAVEWGSGRRSGMLSNIHLGARDPARPGTFVMLGKTFKGMTDEMLAWQTSHFDTLAERREGHVVWLRPEQVVEIAFDGVQRSTRYPGGLALRFARVLRYRSDKSASEADTIDEVRAFAEWAQPRVE